MPKPKPKPAYYFFMLDFQEEQRRKGIHYQNKQEVQIACDPSWRSAPPSVRNKYEQMAKMEKEKFKGSTKKFTSNGTCVDDIAAEQQALKELEEREVQYIKNFVQMQTINGTLYNADFFLIDVNTYCRAGDHYLMAESTVLRFNMAEGIRDIYHEMINPGRIPIGYVSDVKLGATELGLDMPDEEAKRTDYLSVLANIMDYLRRSSKDGQLPPLYTLAEKVGQVQDFVLQLCRHAREDETEIRVYKLDQLFFNLVNWIQTRPEEGYPKPSLAAGQLKKDLFKYTPKLACDHHEDRDKGMECTSSRVRRWAFTIMDKCCPVAGIEPVPGRHIPNDVDIEGVLSYKDKKATEYRTLEQRCMSSSSCYSSVVDEPTDSVVAAPVNKPKPKRVHEPLRKPKTNFATGPLLNDEEFPQLGRRGRGSGLDSAMNNISLNK